MLDELFEIFERKSRRTPDSPSGIRGFIARAVAGDDLERGRRHQYDERRRDVADDEDFGRRGEKKRRPFDAFDAD